MGKQLFSNNAATEISGTLSQGGTTLVLATGTGEYFPAPTGGDYFLGTLYETDQSGNEVRIEIVKVTARTADTLTLVRDFEDMTGQAGGFAYPSEPAKTVSFELRWTAAAAGNTLQRASNLADMDDAATARTNLGLGSAALAATADFATAVHDHNSAYEAKNVNIQTHIGSTANPHGVTKAQVGLSNVDNTSDLSKPISTATQTALDGKLAPALGNTAVSGFKTATFDSQYTRSGTTGAQTVDWTVAQNQKQPEPTGAITYTFTAPPGPCHLQLLIDSDGTSTAQTITWPGTVIWLGSIWAGASNKKAVINFWYDGANYYAIGVNQV